MKVRCPWCERLVGVMSGDILPRHRLPHDEEICPASRRQLSAEFLANWATKESIMIPSQYMDHNGKFDASRVEVSEAEIDAALSINSVAQPNRSREATRWNIALGKAIGTYGCEYEGDQLAISQRKMANFSIGKKGARV